MTVPNQVVIVLDDLRYELFTFMEQAVRCMRLGTSFPNHRLNTGLCQVFRATFFSGQWSLDHGCVGNDHGELVDNGWTDWITTHPTPESRHNQTIAAALAAAGVECHFRGKYLNELAGRRVTDGVTHGNTTFDSATADFHDRDLGMWITGTDMGTGRKIVHVNSSTQVVLNAAATGSHSGLTEVFGYRGDRPLADGWTSMKQLVCAGDAAQLDGGTVTQQQTYNYLIFDAAAQAFLPVNDAGAGTDQYVSEYILAECEDVIASATEPYFLYAAITQPHVPFTPLPEDINAWADFTWTINEETHVATRPSFVRARPGLDGNDRWSIREYVRHSLREQKSVNEFIAGILAAVDLDNTIVYVTNDNGVQLGEARLSTYASASNPIQDIKNQPYDASIHSPLVIIGPGWEAGATIEAPVSNIDIPATIMATGGADLAWRTVNTPNVCTAKQHGVDLRDVAANPGAYMGRVLFHEAHQSNSTPKSQSVSTRTRKLIRYYDVYPGNIVIGGVTVHSAGDAIDPDDQYELFDLINDPNESNNLAASAAIDPETGNPWTDTVTALDAEIDAMLAL